VLGVDTYRDEHVVSVVAAPAAVWSPGRERPRTYGYRELLRVAEQHASGRRA
jgi:hypothetical protein